MWSDAAALSLLQTCGRIVPEKVARYQAILLDFQKRANENNQNVYQTL